MFCLFVAIKCYYYYYYYSYYYYYYFLTYHTDSGTALYGRAVARVKISKQGHSLASCRSLILYFSKLGKAKDENENIDLKFLESMLKGGTDVNFADKHGQTIMHEIARAWHPNVLKFIIEHGGDVNQADYYGRTPLHLASAVDYPEMVEFLVKNGGKHALTL